MVLATGLAFLMLFFGGGGGLINMSYGMNAMVHNTSWVTAHFHLIFGGTVVIMYFAIAYAMWPRLTGRDFPSLKPLTTQLWLWFAGHDDHDPAVALHRPAGAMAPGRRLRLFRPDDRRLGALGDRLAGRRDHPRGQRSAVRRQPRHAAPARGQPPTPRRPFAYALAVHPPERVPASLNGFGLWNILVAVLMLVAYGYPIAQFFIDPPPQAVIHRLG